MAVSGIDITILRDIVGVVATRVRGAATILIDETLIAGGAAGNYVLLLGSLTNGSIDDEMRIPLSPGSNTVSFETEILVNGGDSFAFRMDVITGADVSGVSTSWASIEVTQLDFLTHDIGDSVTTPLVMTPVPVPSEAIVGSSGCVIYKTGAIAGVTTIDVVGYYGNWSDTEEHVPDSPHFGVTQIYFPRWFTEADYVPIAAQPLPVFGSSYPEFDGHFGFTSNTPEGFPETEGYPILCKVKLDGAAPVLCVLRSGGGG